VPIVWQSGCHSLLEPSGPVQKSLYLLLPKKIVHLIKHYLILVVFINRISERHLWETTAVHVFSESTANCRPWDCVTMATFAVKKKGTTYCLSGFELWTLQWRSWHVTAWKQRLAVFRSLVRGNYGPSGYSQLLNTCYTKCDGHFTGFSSNFPAHCRYFTRYTIFYIYKLVRVSIVVFWLWHRAVWYDYYQRRQFPGYVISNLVNSDSLKILINYYYH
jgi:hypothetical protein